MQTTHPPVSAGVSPPPIPGALTHYPAIHLGTFRNTRAALAAVRCVGAAADLQLANAKAEGSPAVAVPVTVSNAPRGAGQCIALVQRKPGDKAHLFLGLLYLATEDRSEAVAIAGELLKSSTTGRQVGVFSWTRQTGATQ